MTNFVIFSKSGAGIGTLAAPLKHLRGRLAASLVLLTVEAVHAITELGV